MPLANDAAQRSPENLVRPKFVSHFCSRHALYMYSVIMNTGASNVTSRRSLLSYSPRHGPGRARSAAPQSELGSTRDNRSTNTKLLTDSRIPQSPQQFCWTREATVLQQSSQPDSRLSQMSSTIILFYALMSSLVDSLTPQVRIAMYTLAGDVVDTNTPSPEMSFSVVRLWYI